MPAKEDFNLHLYQADVLLQRRYRDFLNNNGIIEFLEAYIPPKITKLELCRLVLDLGYPKTALAEYQTMTISSIAQLLLRLLLDDVTVQPEVLQKAAYHPDATQLTKAPRPPSLANYTLDRFAVDLALAQRILVITGAGISTSLGIPDFRSFKGLYAQLAHLNLKDPQHAFDINTFKRHPDIFYSIAHLIIPPDGKYTILHAFLKLLQNKNKLLRNYTQNIDNLEHSVGIVDEHLIQCHGSFGLATCLTCRSKFSGDKIFGHIRHQQVPRCLNCYRTVQLDDEVPINYGVIKPDITFFGEDLPRRYHNLIKPDCLNSDMIIVVGTSLKVEPVASIIDKVPRNVPRILINKEDIAEKDFDLRLLGYCDDVISHVANLMGHDWNIPHESYNPAHQWAVKSVPDSTNSFSIASP